jgi:hypothetical protein
MLDRSVDPEVLSGVRSDLLALEMLLLPLLPDLMLVVSPLSSFASDEDRGLSALREEPGILDRRERKLRELSFVSDLLREG